MLNGTTPVQPEKADRVRLAMDELQFVPRHAARVLASNRTNTIGLLLPEISGAFFSPMLKGIEAGAHETGYDLLIHSTQQVETTRRRLGEHNTDGLLIFTNSLAPSQLRRLHAINFPIVLLHQTPPEGLNIPTIAIENKDGAAMLISHLIEKHGRRRIVYLRGPEGHEDSVWRERGYREALRSHRVQFDIGLRFSCRSGHRAMIPFPRTVFHLGLLIGSFSLALAQYPIITSKPLTIALHELAISMDKEAGKQPCLPANDT